MPNRILYFGNPLYLSTKNKQLIISSYEEISLPQKTKEFERSIPIEDIGIVILDDYRIVISQNLITELLDNNVGLVNCNNIHHPTGLMLNLDGHTLQSSKFRSQLEASQPLMKQLWQQTIKSKISNQSSLLSYFGYDILNMKRFVDSVKSGDPENIEAQAAVFYWKKLFSKIENFSRRRDGIPPNNLLNYVYAILRAIVARSLVGSGLLPTLGIHHHNQYNHYCLADDIMEPYRPFGDQIVMKIIDSGESYNDLTIDLKKILIGIGNIDVIIDDKKTHLINAVQKTTASLAKCFEGTSKKILYPKFF